MATSTHLSSPTLLLVVLVSALGALVYLNFIFTPANRGDSIAYAFVLAAECFLVAQALLAMWTIIAGNHNPRNYEFHDAQQHLFQLHGSKQRFGMLTASQRKIFRGTRLYLNKRPVSIDVFITTYGEPIEVIRKTAEAARDILGNHETYILDDGKSDEVQELADELGVGYIRRRNNKGAKAGNINHALKRTKGQFFVLFDADFVAKYNFLYETLPFFENKRVAFVQTPQHYDNLNNVISRGAGYIQSLFYMLIQPGKNRFNAAFCVGTNVVFRRKAIEEIGGIYDKSKSEDIWTSILLHEKHWQSIFIPDILAVGHTPDTIQTYSQQQLRWATGGFQILFRHNPLTRKLTIDQKVQYLSTVTFYLNGLAVLLLLTLPVLHIFFNWSAVNLSVAFGTWLGYYAVFYGLQIFLAFYSMGSFRPETMMLATVSFPIYIRALINALLGREQAWQATGKAKNQYRNPFDFIVPQTMVFLFLLFTTAVGIWKAYYYETTALPLIWCLLNCGIFGLFMLTAVREYFSLRKQARLQRKMEAERPNLSKLVKAVGDNE